MDPQDCNLEATRIWVRYEDGSEIGFDLPAANSHKISSTLRSEQQDRHSARFSRAITLVEQPIDQPPNGRRMADRYSPDHYQDVVRDRLPTMFEVLSRRTLAPVDLYYFYIYMRDQQRAVDYRAFLPPNPPQNLQLWHLHRLPLCHGPAPSQRSTNPKTPPTLPLIPRKEPNKPHI